jgi:hypothetical protein
MKIRPVGAELFHADGQTDMTKLIVAFRNFANAPKTSCFWDCVEIDDRSILIKLLLVSPHQTEAFEGK